MFRKTYKHKNFIKNKVSVQGLKQKNVKRRDCIKYPLKSPILIQIYN